MFTVQLIESDAQRRSLYTAKLAENGISIADGPEVAGANLVLASVTDPDITRRVNEVKRLRGKFPDSLLAILTPYVTLEFVYEIAQMVNGVFPTQATEKDDDSWADFAMKLQQVTRE